MTTEEDFEKMVNDLKRFFKRFPLDYMMYPGGTGGEFISAKINEYSKKYQRIDYHTEPDLNRSMVANTQMLSSITFCRSNSDDPDEIYKLMIKEMLDRNETLEYSISKIYSLVQNRKFMFRVHLAKNPFFNTSNTWGLYADKEEWWDFSNCMRHIKVYGRVAPKDLVMDSLRLFFKFTESEQERFDELTSIINERGITMIKEGHAQIITNDKLFKEVGDIKTVLEMSNLDMMPVYQLLYGKWEIKSKVNKSMLENVNMINLSQIFDKGYLSDMLDIDQEHFFLAELKNWHKTNVILMKRNGFDTSKIDHVLK
jgi:hypothetical protein